MENYPDGNKISCHSPFRSSRRCEYELGNLFEELPFPRAICAGELEFVDTPHPEHKFRYEKPFCCGLFNYVPYDKNGYPDIRFSSFYFAICDIVQRIAFGLPPFIPKIEPRVIEIDRFHRKIINPYLTEKEIKLWLKENQNERAATILFPEVV